MIRTDSYVRLTGAHPSQAGWIYTKVPLTATNWEVEVEFAIHGESSLYGDGFALWVTQERAARGPVFGLRDRFTGLGVFFDTYKNNRPGVVFPYVMAMLGDGKTSYDNAHDGKANELAGCPARGIRNAGFPTRARVTYFQDQQLKLELMYKHDGVWATCFDVKDIKLPSVTYLGFSAETGELSDNHDIIAVTTKNLYSPGRGPGKTSGPRKSDPVTLLASSATPVPQQQGGSWLWSLLKFIFSGLFLAAAYVGWTAYRARTVNRF